ncbi:MAG: autotransporter-associated beta strand repeat-containing protein, partial [Kiritimatiellaeota bacterium]|nr:autotransporter-associated beta strand repeat-containing protein [Kiritimatiellota bacterium]
MTNDTALGLGGSGLTFNGGTLQSSGNMTLNNRTVTLTGAGTFTADASTTVTINNAISGAGALTKAGVGTLILSGTNSYTGITTVNGGILTFDSMSSNSIKRLNVAGGAVGAQVNIYGPTTLGTAYVGNASTDLRSVLLITNKLTATRLYVGNTAGSAGAVYQTGGLAALTYVLLGYANSATYGFYQLAGGSLTAGNWEQAAGSGGLGLFYITGGTNTTSSGEGILTANGNGTGVVYITGGVVNGAGQLVNGYSSTGRGEITIAGNANVLLNNAVQLNQAGTTTNFLNLNDGVLQS